MEKRPLKEDYYPLVTTEIRHGFLLVWMGDIAEEVISGQAGEPDFHFDNKEREEILKNFDRRSIDLMKAGYPIVSRGIPDKYIRIAEGKMMKKSQIKAIIKIILNEAIAGGLFGGPKMTPAQKTVVDLLTKRSFRPIKSVPNKDGTLDVILERPWGKGRHGGPRYARITSDGTIGQDKMDVNKYLSVVGERIDAIDPRFKQGCEQPMAAVNIGEEAEDEDLKKAQETAKKVWGHGVKSVYAHPAKSGNKYFKVDAGTGSSQWLIKHAGGQWFHSKGNDVEPVAEKTNPDGTYTDDMESGMKSQFYSGLKEMTNIPTIKFPSGQFTHTELARFNGVSNQTVWQRYLRAVKNGQIIRAGERNNGRYGKPSLLWKVNPNWTTALMARQTPEAEPESDFQIEEMTSSGAAGGQPGGTIRVPAWGTKNRDGSPRAIAAAKKYGKVVKSISEKNE